MNGSTQLIGIIAALIVTAGGVVVLYETSQNYQSGVRGLQKAQAAEQSQNGELQLVNVVGTNVASEGVKYVKIQVRYDGEGELNLSDTFIQLRTDLSTTDLHYRNGTNNRSIATGFYTQ